MTDKHQTKAQLIAQVAALRQQVAQLEDHRRILGSDIAVLAHEVLNTLHQHTAVIRADGIIVTVNTAWDAFARDNGDPTLIATSVGTNYLDVCRRAAESNSPDAQAALDGLMAVLHGERPSFEMEYPCHAPTQPRWYVLQVLPMLQHGLSHLLVTHTDVTARKLAELALRESEERYRAVFETISDFAYIVQVLPDGTRRPEWVTPVTSRISGYDSATMQRPDFWRQITHPADWPIVQAQIDELLANRSASVEYRILSANGEVHWVIDHAQPEWDPLHQRVRRIYGALQDVTERKQAEHNLELLAQAGRELSTTLNLRTIYTTLHRIIQRAMSCDFVFVSRFSAAEQLIYCDYGSGPRGEFDALTLPPIPLEAEGRGTQSRVIRSGEPLLVNDFAAYLRTTDNTHYVDEDGQLRPDTTEEDDPTRSALIVPLKLEGQVVGVVQVLSSTLAAYVPRDLQFLESLAMHVTTALTNAHLFAQLQTELAERQRAENTLRESEEKFSKAFQHAPILMTLSAVEDGRYLEVNDEFVRVSGFSRDEAIGKTSIELGWLSSTDRARILAALHEQGRVSALELTLYAKDQHPVSCVYQGELITINGQSRLLSIAQDITARKQAEAALRESEINYRRLFETLSEGVALNEIIYNDQGEMVDYRILEVNPAYYATAQYDGPVVGRLATDLYQLPVEFITAFWREHKERHTVQFTEMISPANGRYALVATSPFANGRFVTSFIDITERKEAEAALRASEQKFRSFMEQAAVGISLTSEDGRIVEWNEALAQITGLARTEALGRLAWNVQAQLVPFDRRDKYPAEVFREAWRNVVLQCETATTHEVTLHHSEHGVRTIEETIFPIVTQRGRMIGQIVRDLTDQRRLEERYRLLFNEMQDGFVLHELICDKAGIPIDSRFLEVNPAFERMTGLHAADVVGRTLREAVPQLLTGWIEAYGDVALTRRPRKIEGMAIPGGKFYSATAFSPQPGQFAVIFQDITERKQAERQLRLQSAALEAAANGIIITDRQGDIEWANAAFLDLTGYSLTEVIGRNPRDLIRSGKQNREFYRALWDTIIGGQVWRGEIVNRRKDGRLFVEEIAITPVRLNNDGPITHFIAIKQDITARKQVDLALRQYAERLQTLHEIDRGVAVAQSPRETAQTALRHLRRLVPGDHTTVTLFDQSTQHMVVLAAFTNQPDEPIDLVRFPLPAEALEPLLHNQIIHIDDTAADQNPATWGISQRLQTGGVRSYLTAPLIVDGEFIGALNVGAARPNAYDPDHLDIIRELSLQLAIAIHQARLREQIQQHTAQLEQRVALRTRELAAANKRLQELDSLKSKFVAEVSHELRTPVTSLTLYLNLLEHGKPDKSAHYLSQANQQAARMKQLIEDILDISRLERDKTDLTLAPIDLNAVLEQAMVAQLPRATAAGLNVTIDLTANLPAAHGDINRLLQVATNLVANAINYTPAGEVHLRSFQRADRVGFEVQDTGMGIAPEDLPHLFQRFYRGQRASQSSVRGTGLGLSIVKEIVDWHGGEVEVHSEVGVGSTFTVWLPIAP